MDNILFPSSWKNILSNLSYKVQFLDFKGTTIHDEHLKDQLSANY